MQVKPRFVARNSYWVYIYSLHGASLPEHYGRPWITLALLLEALSTRDLRDSEFEDHPDTITSC